MVEYNNTLSAYKRILDIILSGKSFIKHKKSKGASLVPWGTPDVTATGSLCLPFKQHSTSDRLSISQWEELLTLHNNKNNWFQNIHYEEFLVKYEHHKHVPINDNYLYMYKNLAIINCSIVFCTGVHICTVHTYVHKSSSQECEQ